MNKIIKKLDIPAERVYANSIPDNNDIKLYNNYQCICMSPVSIQAPKYDTSGNK